jgi:hypothetical protein
MAYFENQKSLLGKIWRVLPLENVGRYIYVMPFGLFYSYLVSFVAIWYIFSRFGMLYLEKSGNPVTKHWR